MNRINGVKNLPTLTVSLTAASLVRVVIG